MNSFVPKDLLTGPDYRIDNKVLNDGFLNHYKINSKFGEFNAVSNATLRKRIWEVRAMAEMEKVTGTKEFIDSFKESAVRGEPRNNTERSASLMLCTLVRPPSGHSALVIKTFEFCLVFKMFSLSAWWVGQGNRSIEEWLRQLVKILVLRSKSTGLGG